MKHKQNENEDETDNINDDSGYNLRTKRVRLTNSVESYVSPYICKRTYKRKNPLALDLLPTEILNNVLSFVSYEELGNTFRQINRKFRTVTQIMMNGAFRDIEKRLLSFQKVTADSILHSQDDMETRCMCKMLNTIEYLTFHYSIIKSTIWRYTLDHYQAASTCMYAGTILDLYFHVLDIYSRDPARIYTPSILNEYTYLKEVNKITTLTKAFVLFFDRVSEQNLNTTVSCSGCKIMDILDCATEAKKSVKEKVIAGNTLTYKVSYYFCNSWLVALETRDEKPKPWNEQMRLMYMRIRRIVVSHTEMHMEYEQFRREVDVRPNPRTRMRKPINSVYTGYGEVGDMFYYYGTMNEGAYSNKFDVLAIDLQVFDEESDDDVSVREDVIPFMGLCVEINLKCPLYLAPSDIFKHHVHSYEDNEIEISTEDELSEFDLKIDFHCPGAHYPRLPTTYTVRINDSR